MKVGGSIFPTLPAPINRREELFDRRQNDRRQNDVVEPASGTAQTGAERGEITRIRTRSSVESQRADAQTHSFAELLNGRSRTAVDAYRSNGPTIEERLGVELAGVDVYA